jgi:uncharacterized RDD family membrane protein YckC
VDLDDRLTLQAPEGVELQLLLAGLGSRFIAGAVDLAIQAILILILALATGFLAGSASVLVAVFFIGAFAIVFLYPIFFEVLAGGRTPGKMLSHLRVVRDSGAPVDLPASALRNLMRLLDGPPLLYLPTVLSIALSSRNQRPGDLVAGTVVIRELPARALVRRERRDARADGPHSRAPAWDVSAVSQQEIAAVRRFLERREGLDREARRRLAVRLSEGLRGKVAGAPADLGPERFLEELARSKA